MRKPSARDRLSNTVQRRRWIEISISARRLASRTLAFRLHTAPGVLSQAIVVGSADEAVAHGLRCRQAAGPTAVSAEVRRRKLDQCGSVARSKRRNCVPLSQPRRLPVSGIGSGEPASDAARAATDAAAARALRPRTKPNSDGGCASWRRSCKASSTSRVGRKARGLARQRIAFGGQAAGATGLKQMAGRPEATDLTPEGASA